jgi:hypothetical protein
MEPVYSLIKFSKAKTNLEDEPYLKTALDEAKEK